MAHKLTAYGVSRLSLMGGISQASKPYLVADVTPRLVEPKADPVEDAIMMARHA